MQRTQVCGGENPSPPKPSALGELLACLCLRRALTLFLVEGRTLSRSNKMRGPIIESFQHPMFGRRKAEIFAAVRAHIFNQVRRFSSPGYVLV
jgi:hypothetical protein